jgi:hypothetical protein
LSASDLRVGFRPSPGIRLLSCRCQLFASVFGAAKAARPSGFSVVGVSSWRRLPAQARPPGHQASQLSASALFVGFRRKQGRPGIRLLSCRRQLFASAFGAGKAARASGFSVVGVTYWRRLSAQARPLGIRLLSRRRQLFASGSGSAGHQASHLSASALRVGFRRKQCRPAITRTHKGYSKLLASAVGASYALVRHKLANHRRQFPAHQQGHDRVYTYAHSGEIVIGLSFRSSWSDIDVRGLEEAYLLRMRKRL